MKQDLCINAESLVQFRIQIWYYTLFVVSSLLNSGIRMTSLLASLVVVAAVLLASTSASFISGKHACAFCPGRLINPTCLCGEMLDTIGCPTGICRPCYRKNYCSRISMCPTRCRRGYCHSYTTGCMVCTCREYSITRPGIITY
ncbi:uncharacterized protein LOC121372901 [Gigantopelta aegis]|uniref:uncharacterized protein LOC121372901 n=1 Tax=Gigantopelta aegis TaxID=1735272 RepID=UPI001B88AE02|nr:uncharacterized protein LOC121372901 [Gigantopelta aegis]